MNEIKTYPIKTQSVKTYEAVASEVPCVSLKIKWIKDYWHPVGPFFMKQYFKIRDFIEKYPETDDNATISDTTSSNLYTRAELEPVLVNQVEDVDYQEAEDNNRKTTPTWLPFLPLNPYVPQEARYVGLKRMSLLQNTVWSTKKLSKYTNIFKNKKNKSIVIVFDQFELTQNHPYTNIVSVNISNTNYQTISSKKITEIKLEEQVYNICSPVVLVVGLKKNVLNVVKTLLTSNKYLLCIILIHKRKITFVKRLDLNNRLSLSYKTVKISDLYKENKKLKKKYNIALETPQQSLIDLLHLRLQHQQKNEQHLPVEKKLFPTIIFSSQNLDDLCALPWWLTKSDKLEKEQRRTTQVPDDEDAVVDTEKPEIINLDNNNNMDINIDIFIRKLEDFGWSSNIHQTFQVTNTKNTDVISFTLRRCTTYPRGTLWVPYEENMKKWLSKHPTHDIREINYVFSLNAMSFELEF